MDLLHKTAQPVSLAASESKKNVWLNSFIQSTESRTKPIFQNTIGSFTDNRSLKAATNNHTIVTESKHSNLTFRDYDRYTREVSPSGSKSDFKHFLMQKSCDTKLYDSNVRHELNHHYKVLAYKEKELNQRALALENFQQQRNVHNSLQKSKDLTKSIADRTKVRHSPDQFDQRVAPRKFTHITNYCKMMKDTRVFQNDSQVQRMRVIRPNV